MAKAAEEAGPVAAGSPWNSLELARLVVSAGIALAVFGLGYVVTKTNTDNAFKRDDKIQRDALTREATAKVQTIAREDKIRKEGEERDTEIRRQATTENHRVQDQAYAREKVLREEGYARDNSIRHEARREARLDRILAERVKFWSVVGPTINAITVKIIGIWMGEHSSSAVHISDVERQVITDPYMSIEFHAAFTAWEKAAVDSLVRVPGHNEWQRDAALRKPFDDLNSSYTRLMDAARNDLAMKDEEVTRATGH